MTVPNITTREQLAAFRDEHQLRPDWHEPDESGISARVAGGGLDNAHQRDFTEVNIWGGLSSDEEQTVILFKDREPVATINLATLLAMASDPVSSKPQLAYTQDVYEIWYVKDDGMLGSRFSSDEDPSIPWASRRLEVAVGRIQRVAELTGRRFAIMFNGEIVRMVERKDASNA